jgi:hypothetical protein
VKKAAELVLSEAQCQEGKGYPECASRAGRDDLSRVKRRSAMERYIVRQQALKY